MHQPTQPPLNRAAGDGFPIPELAPPPQAHAVTRVEAASTLPTVRFFGVPFMKGLAREVTAIHLCPAMVHLATILDGSELAVSNRLTLRPLDLGGLTRARSIAFRPRPEGSEAIELAIIPPAGKTIARHDLQAGRAMPGLPLEAATAIRYSGDGRFVAAGNEAGRVRAWLLGPEGPTLVLEDLFAAEVRSLAFHPEHPTLYATLATGALVETQLAPSPAASVVAALQERAPGARMLQAATGRSGYALYLAGQDDRVYVVDTATGEIGVFSPKVGPILDLKVLPASGHLCVQGRHSVYLVHAVGTSPEEHLALVCTFEEPIYAAWELDPDVVLVFRA
jgi:hypothetical protein